jgi:hypothetical protein
MTEDVMKADLCERKVVAVKKGKLSSETDFTSEEIIISKFGRTKKTDDERA